MKIRADSIVPGMIIRNPKGLWQEVLATGVRNEPYGRVTLAVRPDAEAPAETFVVLVYEAPAMVEVEEAHEDFMEKLAAVCS